MGANFTSKSYDGKMAQQQVMKQFRADQEQDRFENGNSYSGSFGMFHDVRDTGLTFDTYQQAEARFERAEKDDGFLVRIKVCDLQKSKRYQNAAMKAQQFDSELWEFARANPNSKRITKMKEKKAKLWEKALEIEKELAAKSSKTQWVILGWVSE